MKQTMEGMMSGVWSAQKEVDIRVAVLRTAIQRGKSWFADREARHSFVGLHHAGQKSLRCLQRLIAAMESRVDYVNRTLAGSAAEDLNKLIAELNSPLRFSTDPVHQLLDEAPMPEVHPDGIAFVIEHLIASIDGLPDVQRSHERRASQRFSRRAA
jgi:hypothetical protein